MDPALNEHSCLGEEGELPPFLWATRENLGVSISLTMTMARH